MMFPPSTKESAKQDALSWMMSSEQNLRTRPQATRSPEWVKDPVWIRTLVATAAGPTVGANCRGEDPTDAMGWLNLWGRWTARCPESGLLPRSTTHTTIYPGSVPSLEVKHLLLLVCSLLMVEHKGYRLLLELCSPPTVGGGSEEGEDPIPLSGGEGRPYMVADPLQLGPTG